MKVFMDSGPSAARSILWRFMEVRCPHHTERFISGNPIHRSRAAIHCRTDRKTSVKHSMYLRVNGTQENFVSM